jgi:hypothetical protein
MKKYDIIYDWPIAEITAVADSQEAEDFANTLDSEKQSKFVTLTERMRSARDELNHAKNTKDLFQNWSDIISYVDVFSNQFTFRSASIAKLKLSLLFCEKLTQASPTLDETEIDTDLFELQNLTQPVPQAFFCKENSQSFTDSVVLFSNDLSAVSSELSLAIVSPDLLFQFIAALHKAATLPESQAVLIKKTNPSVDISAINAFVRLVVLATGEPVHSVVRYNVPLKILNPNDLTPGTEYQQWSETINVLSEYNSRDEILLKFLTIYHVIENFMFKHPIVELERQRNGGMFSIRDFRRLYSGVNLNEIEALKKLFKVVFEMQASAQKKFKEHLIQRFQGLAPIAALKTDISTALATLGLDFTFSSFNEQSALSCFSKLVYETRNSIVHNKETEFHLTYASLGANPALRKIIEQFLLPSLEEICFALISKPNNELWYKNKALHLYK